MSKIINLKNNQEKFDFNDITIIPFEQSTVDSRSEVNPYIVYKDVDSIGHDIKLPIMVSPMYSCFTLNKNHFNPKFDEILHLNHIPFCYTRGYKNTDSYLTSKYNNYISNSLKEFEHFIKINKPEDISKVNILIDIANGHMKKLHDVVKESKEVFGDKIKLMVGNVANPKTYKILSEYGVDAIRISVGSGSVCTTSANTAIHYPIASLIHECYQIKKEYGFKTEIIADGGFSKFSDIIKAIALGADYVMMGSVFATMLESNSKVYAWKKIPINNYELAQWCIKKNIPLYRKHIGMSTKYIQKIWGKEKLTTSEGIIKWVKITDDINSWKNNFVDYLKSTMSYSGCRTLEEFKDNSELCLISTNAFNRFNK